MMQQQEEITTFVTHDRFIPPDIDKHIMFDIIEYSNQFGLTITEMYMDSRSWLTTTEADIEGKCVRALNGLMDHSGLELEILDNFGIFAYWPHTGTLMLRRIG